MSTLVEIQLKSLAIRENGDLKQGEASNALSTSLLYPAPGKPVITTIKELKLTDDQVVDYENGDNPATGAPYTWSDRIVLKEEIRDSTVLVAQLTDVEKTSKLDRFLAGMFKNIFKALWGLVTEGVGNVILGAVSDSLASAHLESFKIKGESVNVIGRAERHISAADLPAVGNTLEVTLDLVVPKTIETRVTVFDDQTHRPKHTKKLVLSKGEGNGTVVFTLKNLGPA